MPSISDSDVQEVTLTPPTPPSAQPPQHSTRLLSTASSSSLNSVQVTSEQQRDQGSAEGDIEGSDSDESPVKRYKQKHIRKAKLSEDESEDGLSDIERSLSEYITKKNKTANCVLQGEHIGNSLVTSTITFKELLSNEISRAT
jgi:hypothetical protein